VKIKHEFESKRILKLSFLFNEITAVCQKNMPTLSIIFVNSKPYSKRLWPVYQGPRGSCLMKNWSKILCQGPIKAFVKAAKAKLSLGMWWLSWLRQLGYTRQRTQLSQVRIRLPSQSPEWGQELWLCILKNQNPSMWGISVWVKKVILSTSYWYCLKLKVNEKYKQGSKVMLGNYWVNT
jgi:hypothetical protein